MAKFYNKDVRSLLEQKTVIVMGDSIQRSVYKDLVCLLKQEDSRYLYDVELRAKGEHVFLGDKLLSGGKFLVNSLGKMPNGTDYREVREFRQDSTLFRYYFLTRCFSEHMESILNELKTLKPDVIIMNSCLWDIHHYGPNSLVEYNENIPKLLKASETLPFTLFIWNATLPLAQKCKGGFFKPGFHSLPVEDIKTANRFAWTHVTQFPRGIYLDLYTELQQDLGVFTQAADGIHWGMKAHRKISNLILERVALHWGKEVPRPPPPEFPMEEDVSGMNTYYYPLPKYHSQEEWNPVEDFDDQAPDYWNEMPSIYYSPALLQQPDSGFPVDYKFYERPSLLGPGPQFPNQGGSFSYPMSSEFYPGQAYWGTPPNPYTHPMGQFIEPPMKQMRYSDPLPFYGASNFSFPWNQNPSPSQFFQHSQQSEARYRVRLFNSKNKQKKRKRGGGTPLNTGSKMQNRANALFQSPNLNGSSTASQNAPVSETNTTVPSKSDVNNNPEQKPPESKLDEVKVDSEPRVGAGELKDTPSDTQKEAPSDTSLDTQKEAPSDTPSDTPLDTQKEAPSDTPSDTPLDTQKEAPSDTPSVQEPIVSDPSESALANKAPDAEAVTSSDQPKSNSHPLVNGSTTQDSDDKPIASSPKATDKDVDKEKGLKRKRSSDTEETQPLKVGRVDELSASDASFDGFI